MHLERRMIVDACNRAIAETRRFFTLRPGLLLSYGALSGIAFAYAWHLAWVCDDAYISFRYARNLAEGNGLVFNVGESVEGYTNFLWVLEMALLHLLGIPLPAASQVLSGLLSVAVLALSIRMALAGPARAFRHFSAVVVLGVLATSRHVAM